MLQDGGAFVAKAEFEDDQGITPDDDDALAVETGEFCLPPARSMPVRRGPVKNSAPASKRPVAMIPPPSPSGTDDSGQEERPAKKYKQA